MKEPPFTHVQKPPVLKYFAMSSYASDPPNVSVGDTPEEAVANLTDYFAVDTDDVIVYGATVVSKSVIFKCEVDFG